MKDQFLSEKSRSYEKYLFQLSLKHKKKKRSSPKFDSNFFMKNHSCLVSRWLCLKNVSPEAHNCDCIEFQLLEIGSPRGPQVQS